MPVSSPDLVGYIDNKYSDGQVRFIIRFNGILDEKRLGKAVRLAFDAEPVTGCRLIERPLRLYWQRCTDLESAFEFHIVDHSDHNKGIYEYLLAPLDPFKGPQVKVGLFRSGFDTLYIKMSHIVADGGASIEYIQLLSSIYRNLEKEPEYRPASNLKGSRSSFQVLRHVGLKKILASCTGISISRSSWEFPDTDNGNIRPSFFIRRIGRGRLSHIKAYAKNHCVTMGDILLTAYYRALFEVLDPPENIPIPLMVPVNLRRYIPGGRSEAICSLTAGYFPEIIRNKTESFEETLARVHTVMESNKSIQEELGQLLLMELAFAPGHIIPRILEPFLSSVFATPSFSNFGVVEPMIADFGGIKIQDMIPAGPMTYPPHFVLGSHTFNDELTLTSIVCGTEAYRTLVECFFDILVRELPGYSLDEVDIVQEEVVANKPGHDTIEVYIREKYISDA
ncbi:hypothetical protein CUJ83_12270 [Methanocella sp. CWC-04]|uniref:Condensation domain-containing protein n=1 Tax=Methanooceanicella nereidis TaxID=2052831 RepID=A0AAP2RDS4_9EURY|nr:hypothetical protein [Methanocella sp. CWC-04]MCD1295774.1 hypothetical protein [Methanocella sp. CWC-04]